MKIPEYPDDPHHWAKLYSLAKDKKYEILMLHEMRARSYDVERFIIERIAEISIALSIQLEKNVSFHDAATYLKENKKSKLCNYVARYFLENLEPGYKRKYKCLIGCKLNYG